MKKESELHMKSYIYIVLGTLLFTCLLSAAMYSDFFQIRLKKRSTLLTSEGDAISEAILPSNLDLVITTITPTVTDTLPTQVATVLPTVVATKKPVVTVKPTAKPTKTVVPTNTPTTTATPTPTVNYSVPWTVAPNCPSSNMACVPCTSGSDCRYEPGKNARFSWVGLPG